MNMAQGWRVHALMAAVLWTIGWSGSVCAQSSASLSASVSRDSHGDAPRRLADYTHDAWRMTDGLPQDSITAGRQTRDGFIWVGTMDGLARVDGVRDHSRASFSHGICPDCAGKMERAERE